MSDITTTLAGIAPTTAEIIYAQGDGGDLSGMVALANEKAAQLMVMLNNLVAAFAPGDSNLTTLYAQALALLQTGQLNFSLPSQSQHLLTMRF